MKKVNPIQFGGGRDDAFADVSEVYGADKRYKHKRLSKLCTMAK